MSDDRTVCFNHVDFCLRVRDAGGDVIWTPDALLVHHESATRGTRGTPEGTRELEASLDLLKIRWQRFMADDCAYNPTFRLTAFRFL